MANTIQQNAPVVIMPSLTVHDFQTHYTPRIRSKTEPETWETTLEKCIKSIISIKATRVRCLDTETPGAFTATGFVVDPVRGIILSNRHVVSVSPIVAQAVLCNYEEIELVPIYRDPVHDFGFLKYDPTHVRFLTIPGIPLCPEGARVGQEIRVVGNDAGEKLSILAGTLARLDRETPNYGIGEYNDFDTFYMQAASSTSAGSSGSPVLDVYGRAIALNAGGATNSSSSYYLPLNRVKRALECIQNSQHVSRGTIQAEFEYRSYDELSQLGLSLHIEARLRLYNQESIQGLLVVKSVLPLGPADGHLASGDILLTGNGRIVTHFLDLADLLDNSVHNTIELVVSRGQGVLHQVKVTVQDLHAITPNRFIEFGGGILNDLSYQMARSYGLSLDKPGVYVAAAGYILGTALALRKSVIIGLNNQVVRNLDDFIKISKEIPQGERVPIRYYSLSRALKDKVMILHVDHTWHKFRMAIRNDTTGLWDYKNLGEPPIITPLLKVPRRLFSVKTDPFQRLAKSLVAVDAHPPYIIDGLKNSHSYGAGLIVSMDPPLVVCDRDTIPVGISAISLTFGNAITMSARLLFLHPFYNYAVLTFDWDRLESSGIEVHVAMFSDKVLKPGDRVNYVGLGGKFPTSATVSMLKPIRTKETSPPRWRAMNVEAYKTSEGSLNGQGGVLADEDGKVQASWMSFSNEDERGNQGGEMGGLSAHLILPILDAIRAGEVPGVRGLDAELWTMQLANARLLGLPEHWLDRYQETENQSHVLYITGITDASSPCAGLLSAGDIVLLINGVMMMNVSDLARFSQEEELKMTIFRNGHELEIVVPTTYFNGQETTRVIGWQGMLVQDAYMAAKEQMQKEVPKGLYVSCCLFGSPAQMSLRPGIWITEINQRPVHTLDEFFDAVKLGNRSKKIESAPIELTSDSLTKDASWLLSSPDASQKSVTEKAESHVHVKYVSRNNGTHLVALRLDHHYWPTWQIQKDTNSPFGWYLTSF
ncbi:hypothetical protein J3Q64DRAFT_1856306 [Phycomyces blakesleeanus]|uniref:PDZ domain-containing protein n=1 Tax=Phycomyces blakesleeanus TaxID=4837 RepID=A0ABR3BH15_PHYBL